MALLNVVLLYQLIKHKKMVEKASYNIEINLLQTQVNQS